MVDWLPISTITERPADRPILLTDGKRRWFSHPYGGAVEREICDWLGQGWIATHWCDPGFPPPSDQRGASYEGMRRA